MEARSGGCAHIFGSDLSDDLLGHSDEGVAVVSWYWLPIVFLAGAWVGAIVIVCAWCLCAVAGMSDDAEKTVVAKE